MDHPHSVGSEAERRCGVAARKDMATAKDILNNPRLSLPLSHTDSVTFSRDARIS